MSAAPSPNARKPPNLWALASVTYGLVIVVTILSILAYYYLAPKRTATQQIFEAERSMAVGSVWIAVYPGAAIESTASANQDGATQSTLTFGTKDRADRVLSFYQAALKKGVFRFETVTKNADGGTIQSIVHEGKTTVVVKIHATAEGAPGRNPHHRPGFRR